MRLLKHCRTVASFVFLLSLSGCGAKDIVDEIVQALDDAVYTLDQNSAEYQTILRNLMAQLENIDSDASAILRRDIAGLLERTPAVVGQEFRCNVDFVGDRLRQGLQCAQRNFMLTNLYSGGRAIPECVSSRPAVCAVVPSAIDQQLGVRTVDVYGYDFDLGVSARLTRYDGSSSIVTSYLATPSHYHLTLNVGDNGVRNIYEYDFLELLHKEITFSSVSIVSGMVCTRINPGSRTVVLNELSDCNKSKYAWFPGGVTVKTSVYVSDDMKSLRGSIEVNDTGYGIERYRRTVDEFSLFSAPVDFLVSGSNVESEDFLNFNDDDERVNYVERGNGGLVNQYELKIGMLSCSSTNGYVKVTFNSFDVCTSRQ